MLGNLGRRAIDLAVLFLALYAFAFVPLGRRTGFEHLRAILRTRAAEDAGHEIALAVDRLRRRLVGDALAEEPPRPHGRAELPRLPKPRAPANAAVTPREAPDANL